MTKPTDDLDRELIENFYAEGLPFHRDRWIPDLNKIRFSKLRDFIRQRERKAVNKAQEEMAIELAKKLGAIIEHHQNQQYEYQTGWLACIEHMKQILSHPKDKPNQQTK